MSAVDELHELCNITQLLYRRNKNQHRRSHWWRHFNLFRRQFGRLCKEISPLNAVSGAATSLQLSTSIENTELSNQINDAWVRLYVPQWYYAFSQILAERRFAALGLTLLAILARVCEITGVTRRLQEEATVDQAVLLKLDQYANGNGFAAELLHGLKAVAAPTRADEDVSDDDVGVPVERLSNQLATKEEQHGSMRSVKPKVPDEVPIVDEGEKGTEHRLANDGHDNLAPVPQAPHPKKKNRIPKANCIDDIFGAQPDSSPTTKDKRKRKKITK